MPKKLTALLLLILSAALSGCALTGKDVRPQEICPDPPKPSPALMRTPDYEQRIRAILFGSEPSAMPKSEDSKQRPPW